MRAISSRAISGEPITDSHLRLIFADAVLSFNLAADATLEDIAQALAERMRKPFSRRVIAIDITFGRRESA